MKILFVSDFYYDINTGAAGSLITIGRNFENLGHKVDYIWRKEKRLIKSNNFYRFLELPFVQYSQIKEALLKKHYDVIIISQPHAYYAAKRLKNKYPKTLFLNRTHGWELRLEEINKSLIKKNTSFFKKFKFFLSSNLMSHCSFATMVNIDAILCASSDDADYIQKQYPKYSHKVFSISYGLSPDFLNLKIPKENTQVVKLLFVGQYLERKGINDIKITLSKLKESSLPFQITFVVNEEAIADVKQDFNFIDGSCLKVSSWMKREELIATYKKNDIFLMPSYGEGFGKTVIEAMACELCVVGYSEGALSDLGKHQENALVYDKGNVEGFTDGIQYLIQNSIELKRLKKSAYQDVQKYTWLNHSKQTIEILNELRS